MADSLAPKNPTPPDFFITSLLVISGLAATPLI
jgi:hypothetical protein